jgi:hypothetical protein
MDSSAHESKVNSNGTGPGATWMSVLATMEHDCSNKIHATWKMQLSSHTVQHSTTTE